MPVSPAEVERLFLEFLDREGLTPARASDIRADGKLRRYNIAEDDEKKRTGAYALHADGWPNGWGMDWRRGGNEKSYWKMSREYLPELSEEDRKKYAEDMEARRKAAAEETRRLQGEAAKRARSMWDAATPIGAEVLRSNAYLKKKKIREAVGAKLLGNDILVPLHTPGGQLVSLQKIPPEGKKTFLTFGLTRGCFCMLGEDEAWNGRYVFVCEGWATGVTVYEATGCAVAIAFSAGNLRHVTGTMLERYPGKLALAPDNDRSRGNPGMTQAFSIEDEFDIPLAVPAFKDGEQGTDWNDYAARHDIEATSEAIFAALEKWEAKVILERETRQPKWIKVNAKGKPSSTIGNLEILLRGQGIRLVYDEIAKDAVMTIPGTKYHPDGKVAAEVAHVLSLCAEFGLPRSQIEEYLTNISMKNPVNYVKDWIKKAVWDGSDRLEELYATISVSKGFSEELKNLIIRRWLISAVAAAFSKGEFYNRGVLVLQGRQGMGKTSWLANLVSRNLTWFSSRPSLDPRDRDAVKQALSYWITELGELEGIFKGDLARLKAFLTLQQDELRLPYGKTYSKFARRTVFCASVNQAEFLSDKTGNSRWWVLPCVEIDYAHKIDMRQLWAQAHELYAAGERWYFNRAEEDELSESNWEFEQADEIEDIIKSKFDWESYERDVELGLCELLTATEALALCKVDKPDRGQAMRAGETLRRLTERRAQRLHGGRRCYLVPRLKDTYG